MVDSALASTGDEGATRTLVGLVSRGRRSPRSGYQVLDPVTGEAVGVVTSGAPSPTLGHPIAIANVPIRFEEPGTRLAVDIRGAQEDVEVVALPFDRRPQN